MEKQLIIVESPAKAKTIGKILGKEFMVKSSIGHIRDLPERSIGIDVDNGFEPKYVLSKGKSKVVEELRKATRECSAIYLAPDPDREGEAIAWHLKEVLANAAKGKPFYRVTYNEITPRAVRAAIAAPGSINQHRVDAQQARRILDRIVGYMVSPLLWRRIKKGLSAGRVQSVALRLVCEREREIESFIPEPYWIIGANVRKQVAPVDPFVVKLAKIDGEKADIRDESTANEILADIEGRALKIADIRTRQVTRRTLPPFTTSTLQQAASSVCGFSPSRTMSLAQRLYEGVDGIQSNATGGLITYMRTDSVSISADARAEARDFIVGQYGPEFYPDQPNFFRSRSGAQEAHEAIRPTDVTLTPQKLKGVLDAPLLRLYDLIWRRFVASQMATARIEQRTAVVAPVPPPAQKHTYEFTATASEILFPGFLKVMELNIKKPVDADENEEADEIDKLPPLEIGEPIELIEWLNDRKETKPPPRFTEASLVKALEANGVGRPSTYASIIETLDTREYVTREKRTLIPSELGLQVSDLLVAQLNDLFDVGFTASMEESLDQVEEGNVQWNEMMQGFYTRFRRWLDNAREPIADKTKLEPLFSMLEHVTEWGAEVKRGRRMYSDERFVQSVRGQHESGNKAVSDKQLQALARVAVRYRSQIPNAEALLTELGYAAILESDAAAPSREEASRRFAVIDTIELSEVQQRFVDSLRLQADSGRKLSQNQLDALDKIIARNAAQIDNFDKVKDALNLFTESNATEVDEESGALLEMMAGITTWREPTTRGKVTFDDHAFYESLSQQYALKKNLSPRQVAALKKMISRYREQIPGYTELAERYKLPLSATDNTDRRRTKTK
ncbi:MAG: type I DNA topoisomerase [Lentisphaerae bacterium]|nr:type I DNA topoisomerase [Lentisphaerota bacterium]